MSTEAGTRLYSVNTILSRAGRGEISALHTGLNSDAANAERELERASLTVQKIGWHFNTYRNVEITRDANNQFQVPGGTITIDSDGADAQCNVAQAGDILYDLDNNTNLWPDKSTLRIRRVEFKTLECVPLPVREYIVVLAAYNFVTQYGSRFMAPSEHVIARNMLYAEMLTARNDARRFDANTTNTNFLNTPNVRAITGDRNRSGPFSNIGNITGVS